MISILELVIQNTNAMRKILLTMLYRFVLSWHHNLENDFIIYFRDCSFKLISHFSISISAKKNTTKLFIVTQREGI
jgi:hypothetical protein